MSYRISNTTYGEHRDTVFVATVVIVDPATNKPKTTYVNKVNACVAKLADQKWWIIPNSPREENAMADIGPFDDVEHAIVHLTLVADAK